MKIRSYSTYCRTSQNNENVHWKYIYAANVRKEMSEGIRWKQQAQEITETLWYGILWYDSFITQLVPFRVIYRL